MNDHETEYNDIIDHLRNDLGDDLNFITITLSPKLYKYQPLTQYEIVHNELQSKLRLFERFASSVELTKHGNIHYHVIAKARNKLNKITFYNTVKKMKKIGMTHTTPASISTMDQLKRSALYLVKDMHVTRKFLHTPNYKPNIITKEFELIV